MLPLSFTLSHSHCTDFLFPSVALTKRQQRQYSETRQRSLCVHICTAGHTRSHINVNMTPLHQDITELCIVSESHVQKCKIGGRGEMTCLGGGHDVVRFLSAQNPTSLFKVLNKLPRFGIGRKVTRVCWNVEDRENKINPPYWTITKVIPNEVHRI